MRGPTSPAIPPYYPVPEFDWRLKQPQRPPAPFFPPQARKEPKGVDSVSASEFHDFLWLFNKLTSAKGSSEDDGRKVTVFKLTKVEEDESTSTLPLGGVAKQVVLTYEQIF